MLSGNTFRPLAAFLSKSPPSPFVDRAYRREDLHPTMPDPSPSDAARNWIQVALERHERALLTYATRMLGGDLERGRDVVQDAFLRLCKENKEEVEGHVAEWLTTVCRNLVFDVRRKESRMTELSETEARCQVAEFESATESAMEAVDTRDAADHLLGQLGALPAKQQEVLRLKFQHGLSYREIGRVMNEKVGTVGWLVHTGIHNLRVHLATGRATGRATRNATKSAS